MEFSTLSNPYNKNSSIFQQMEEFFIAIPNSFLKNAL